MSCDDFFVPLHCYLELFFYIIDLTTELSFLTINY